jgi:branched-chain amino acid transport system substrate-binding protein
MQAYDAANILMTAIGNAIKANGGNRPSRKQVRDEMAKITSFPGVIGTYGFDQNGDTTLKIVSVYLVENSADPSKTSGVCGAKAKNLCFVWKLQFDFGTA